MLWPLWTLGKAIPVLTFNRHDDSRTAYQLSWTARPLSVSSILKWQMPPGDWGGKKSDDGRKFKCYHYKEYIAITVIKEKIPNNLCISNLWRLAIDEVVIVKNGK